MFLSYGVCRLLARAAKNPLEPPSKRRQEGHMHIGTASNNIIVPLNLEMPNFTLK